MCVCVYIWGSSLVYTLRNSIAKYVGVIITEIHKLLGDLWHIIVCMCIREIFPLSRQTDED